MLLLGNARGVAVADDPFDGVVEGHFVQQELESAKRAVCCERQVAIAWNSSQESIQLIILRLRGQAHIDDLDGHRALQQELVCPRNDVLAANDSHSEEKAMILCFL